MKNILSQFNSQIRLYLLLFFFTLAASVAIAAVVNSTMDVTWDPPTQRVDGSNLPPSEIREYNIYVNASYHSTVDGQETTAGVVVNGAGNYCINVTTVDQDGRESVFSNEKCITIEVTNPKAPVLISIGLSSI